MTAMSYDTHVAFPVAHGKRTAGEQILLGSAWSVRESCSLRAGLQIRGQQN
jgi:hypothetical protein